MTISLTTKIIGVSGSHDETLELELGSGHNSVTLEGLIRMKVTEEVRAFNAKQKRRLGMEYRTDEDLLEDMEHGRINVKPKGVVDETKEIKKAIQAFKDGLFQVVMNGRKLEKLDEVIPVRKDLEILFLRTIPLAGG